MGIRAYPEKNVCNLKMKTKKRSLWGDTQGTIVNVWISALVMLFIIIIVYVMTYGVVCVTLYNLAVAMAPVNTEAGYFGVLGLVRMVYNIFVWILIFGVLIWAYLSSQPKEYETGY